MKSQGLWDAMADINTQTLKKFVKTEKEKAEDAGNYDYKIPGLEITEIVRLNMQSRDK